VGEASAPQHAEGKAAQEQLAAANPGADAGPSDRLDEAGDPGGVEPVRMHNRVPATLREEGTAKPKAGTIRGEKKASETDRRRELKPRSQINVAPDLPHAFLLSFFLRWRQITPTKINRGGRR